MKYKLGISTCPNDTFMFHGVLSGNVVCRGFDLEVDLLDIQRLNDGVANNKLHFSKVSCFAAALLKDGYERCDSGAALGYGVGPLLLARKDAPSTVSEGRVLTPGDTTTASLLFNHFFPGASRVDHVTFSEIMPALQRGEADYGVVIHEGRFTYQETGLQCVADLGALWEGETGLPLPLGCLVSARSVPEEHRAEFARVVRTSIEYGYDHRDEAFATMKRYAQELSESVIWRHVDLYVNQWSLDLGELGNQAFSRFDELLRTRRVS
jgi:1,4-dihydroxy-6-naphthoate synthase